jgi:hypothetical protein
MRARVTALLFLLGYVVHSASGYAGFDCGQGVSLLGDQSLLLSEYEGVTAGDAWPCKLQSISCEM